MVKLIIKNSVRSKKKVSKHRAKKKTPNAPKRILSFFCRVLTKWRRKKDGVLETAERSAGAALVLPGEATGSGLQRFG